MRHLTTSIEEAATLAALGYNMAGGHTITAEEASGLREAGDRNARPGSVAFSVIVEDAEVFADLLPTVRNGECFVHLRIYRETIRRCRSLIHELTA